MIKCVIFDLGRVVLHDPDNEIIFKDMAASCKINYQLTSKVVTELIPYYQRGDLNDETFWQEFGRRMNVTPPVDGDELWTREYGKNLSRDESVLNLVQKLKRNGYATPCLSNTIPPHVRFLRNSGILDYFSPQVLSCEVKARKPEKKIYEAALEKINLAPEETVFVDDVLGYIEAARLVGMKGIHYQNFEQLKSELAKFGVKVS